MICGGSARVSIELLRAAPALLILGGGHVGLALARLALPLGYDVTVGDDREEYARPDRFPPGVAAVRTGRDYRLPAETVRPGRDRCVAVVSRCWETDLAALRHWLCDDAPPASYLGLIGSRRKVRGVFARLKEEGVPEDRIARVRAPIGLSIGAVTPEEIAVSILAEITAVRRGAAVPQSVAESRVPSPESR
jgi:xanthine dehydrogenase accessory factor